MLKTRQEELRCDKKKIFQKLILEILTAKSDENIYSYSLFFNSCINCFFIYILLYEKKKRKCEILKIEKNLNQIDKNFEMRIYTDSIKNK